MVNPALSISETNQSPVIHETEENNESCLLKTGALLVSFAQVLNQVLWNAVGDFLHDESFMFADQRFARLKERMSYSSEPISQTPAILEHFLYIPPDSTMNEFDLDRAFYGVYNHLHPRLQKAIHFLLWRQAGNPQIDFEQFGRDLIEATPRSEWVKRAIRHICSHAEFHREYLPHHFVLYTDDVELDTIVLEGIYNIRLKRSGTPEAS